MKICQIGIRFNIGLLFIIVLLSCNSGLDYCGNSGEKAAGTLNDFINDFAFGGEKFLVYNVERGQDIIARLEDIILFTAVLFSPVQKLRHKSNFPRMTFSLSLAGLFRKCVTK